MKTNHARKRAQQRGIPPFIIQLLDDFGAETYDHQGGIIRYLNKKARRSMERELGRAVVRRLDVWLDAYAVCATDGPLVTLGHRYERIRR